MNRIASHAIMGHPEEYLNLNNIEESLTSIRTSNIFEFYDEVTLKMTAASGIFGFQITYFDLEELEKEATLSTLMTGQKYFIYLTRRNFVAQGISLYMAETTKEFHRYRLLSDKLDQNVPFSKEKVLRCIVHILQQEYKLERWFVAKNVIPLRICYEQLVQDMQSTIDQLASYLDCALSPIWGIERPQNVKVSSEKNLAFEALFRQQSISFCQYWESARGKEWPEIRTVAAS